MAVGRQPEDEANETIDLPQEGSTIALAHWLARFAREGDFIALSGDLGAGKTTFARGYLRALTGQAELEAPSPTFTLLQVYAGPDFPVMHADFYRLRGAEELTQLAWHETIEGAVALVEWPERAAEALPPDRLEITLFFDAARGDEFRRAELRARGAMAARFKRARALEILLDAAGGAGARRAPLHGDASSRAYERLTAPDGATAILMILPPRASGPTLRFGKSYAEIARLSADIRAFLAMAEGLRAQGYSTPRILARDIPGGRALVEEFGDE